MWAVSIHLGTGSGAECAEHQAAWLFRDKSTADIFNVKLSSAMEMSRSRTIRDEMWTEVFFICDGDLVDASLEFDKTIREFEAEFKML